MQMREKESYIQMAMLQARTYRIKKEKVDSSHTHGRSKDIYERISIRTFDTEDGNSVALDFNFELLLAA